MPKRRSDAQYAAALSAGLPPESAKFDDDNEWWDAQDDWLVKDPTGVPEQLSPRGEAQRRTDWQRVTKQHAALFEAAAERAANRAVAERAAAERAAACAEAERAAAKCAEAERAGWAWDNEWQCWYNVEESEQQNDNEAQRWQQKRRSFTTGTWNLRCMIGWKMNFSSLSMSCRRPLTVIV